MSIVKSVPKVILALGGVAAGLASFGANADESNFEVRVRAVYLDMANKSDAIPALAVPENAIHVNSKTIPELDLEYFFTPVFSTELVLTYPQKQTVTVEQSALGGATDIGTFKHLPPTLTGKYNFNPAGQFRPYVGLGLNFTLISNVDLAVPTSPPIQLHLSRLSVGPAAQVGFDYKIAEHWFLNADVKWAMLNANVYTQQSVDITRVTLNPWLFGVGGGYRF
jgi:outer membrane protein